VVIPKVYNGKTRRSSGSQGKRTGNRRRLRRRWRSLPRSRGRAIFRKASTPITLNKKIYDPLSTASMAAVDTRGRNSRANRIPVSKLNPVGLALASYYPLPNTAAPYYGANDYTRRRRFTIAPIKLRRN